MNHIIIEETLIGHLQVHWNRNQAGKEKGGG